MFSKTVTVKDIPEVASLIHEVLDGHKYVFVAVNEGFGYRPEVHTDQECRKVSYWQNFESDIYAGLNVCDTYGVWGFSTTQIEGYDATYQNPFVTIEHRKIEITHRAPCGYLLRWLIQIQEDVDD